MPMRGVARDAIVVSPRAFDWDRAVAATLRHSTLPWNAELKGAPLAGAQLGARDRLSLLAQFAAHEAALRFAGLADGELEPAQWAVVQQRGSDVRLVRVAAAGADPTTAPPLLTIAQQFAQLVAAPRLNVLRQSWARAESVYIEAFLRLRADAATDVRWARAAATAAIFSPGPELLRAVATGRHTYRDESIVESLQAFERRVVVLRGNSILRYSALEPLKSAIGEISTLSESQIAERIAARCEGTVLVVGASDLLDGGSKRVIQLLAAIESVCLITRDESAPSLPDRRRFVVAPTLAAARAVEGSDTDALTSGERFDEFLRSGVLATSVAVELQEPLRSYLPAIALLGDEVPREAAQHLLDEFGCDIRVDDLVVEGLTSLDARSLRFRSSSAVARLVPDESRSAICRIAAVAAERCGYVPRAALLLAEAGDLARAATLLENVVWRTPEETIAALDALPRRALTPELASRLTAALTETGRYHDARDIVPLLPDDLRELALARVERRTGDYLPALARLERLARSPEADMLRAEMLSVLRRDDEAKAILDTSDARGEFAAYLRCLVCGTDDLPDSKYLRSRLAVYDALANDDGEAASRHSAEAIGLARSVADRIDAELDLVYSLFHAGRWGDARAAALAALALVEETQGDRAAGGLLFLLAYLYADNGQWSLATQLISRLRHYYGETKDERHLNEIELISAHLDFCRGNFDVAYRAAASLLDAAVDRPVAEAAALIVDEIDGLHHRRVAERPVPQNAEFRRRFQFIRGGPEPASPTPPQAFRIALARGDAAAAAAVAAAAGIAYQAGESGDTVSHILHAVLCGDFPPAPHAVERRWRYAVRNRLGIWSDTGSNPRLDDRALDDLVAEPDPDCILATEREIVQIEGSRSWSAESRETIGEAFRTRAELQRLRRAVEQQERRDPPPRSGADGILGDSPAIRDVAARLALVARREVSVCILGESGTGKELAARAIHRGSPRRQKAFTPVNCSALPENLVESELFGHVRGAFTGADRDRAGLIETTDGGTLFLDEIGEMPLTAQAKLLRFLQEGEFRRVGESVTRSADVRIVAATNRKLDDAVEEGEFREDLYYRIRGIEIVLPPLRDRGGDILLLANHFLALERDAQRSGPSRLSEEVESVFLSYGWPGNVRELENTIRGAHALAGEVVAIELEHLPERLRAVTVTRTLTGSYQDAVTRFRRELIGRALQQVNGNQNRAASLLKMSRQALGYQIRELGIMTGKPRRKAL